MLSAVLLATNVLAMLSVCSAMERGLLKGLMLSANGGKAKQAASGKVKQAAIAKKGVLKGPPVVVPSCDTQILPAYDPTGKPILYAGTTKNWLMNMSFTR